jgi:hypothetical protein
LPNSVRIPVAHTHGLAAPVGHRRAGEDHVAAVADRRVRARGRELLGDRQRLAGKRRLVALQRVVLDHARIGRDAVARLQHEHVARHQLPRSDLALLAVAQHRDHRREHVLQRVEGLLRAVLLHEAQDRAEEHDHQDDDRVHVLAHEGRQDRGDDEDRDQDVLELVEEDVPGGGPLLLRELVGSVLLEAPQRLGGGEPALRVGFQLPDGRAGIEGMPCVGHRELPCLALAKVSPANMAFADGPGSAQAMPS